MIILLLKTFLKVANRIPSPPTPNKALTPPQPPTPGGKEKEEQMVSAQIQIWQLNESNKLEMLIVHYVTKATNAKP